MKGHKGTGHWAVIFYDLASTWSYKKIPKNMDFVLEYVTTVYWRKQNAIPMSKNNYKDYVHV